MSGRNQTKKTKGSRAPTSARFQSSLISIPKPVDIPSLRMESVGLKDSDISSLNEKHSVSMNADSVDTNISWARQASQSVAMTSISEQFKTPPSCPTLVSHPIPPLPTHGSTTDGSEPYKNPIVSTWVDDDEDMDYSQIPVFNPGIDGVQVMPLDPLSVQTVSKDPEIIKQVAPEQVKEADNPWKMKKQFIHSILETEKKTLPVKSESKEGPKQILERPKQGKLYNDKTGEFKVAASNYKSSLDIQIKSKLDKNPKKPSLTSQDTFVQDDKATSCATMTSNTTPCTSANSKESKEKPKTLKAIKKLNHFDSVMGNIKELLDPVSTQAPSTSSTLPSTTKETLEPGKMSTDSVESTQLKLSLPKKPHLAPHQRPNKYNNKNLENTYTPLQSMPCKADLVDSWRRMDSTLSLEESTCCTTTALPTTVPGVEHSTKTLTNNKMHSKSSTTISKSRHKVEQVQVKQGTREHTHSQESKQRQKPIEKNKFKKEKIIAIWNNQPQGPLASKTSIQTMISDVDTILAVHNAMEHLDSFEDAPEECEELNRDLSIPSCQETSDVWNHSLYPSPKKEFNPSTSTSNHPIHKNKNKDKGHANHKQGKEFAKNKKFIKQKKTVLRFELQKKQDHTIVEQFEQS